ncbi:MAG: tRNA pseudouridine(38-40) synthase TruA [Gammaproteobacteria bacterium]|nr:tRNA pseudouridine(38-40) synthase TruA [Gammaproteobacteria bacterium]MDP7271650.1 tRNA pseudouridine(38-40) synthase TruA [Gammaproteobacteria bacterium]HJP04397.1 tRNA pseudouridine(38-40) synthase TruA [Gammaproteobacteria bacterium]
MGRKALKPLQQRLAIGIEYDGTAYNGWQSQPHAPSIQDTLNEALSAVADGPVECAGAGRTDSGVHATGQVAHFDTEATRSNRSWLLGINSNLPDDVSVLWVQTVGDDFHARFSARSRSYRYIILNREVRSALQRHRAWWFRHELDLDNMQAGADLLSGQHDFTSFRAASCQSKSAVRTITDLRVTRAEDYIHIDCTADAFLHHMVRNIVGSLVRVGQGDEPVAWIQQILDSRDRKHMGLTAPAAGLTLTAVDYPAEILPR